MHCKLQPLWSSLCQRRRVIGGVQQSTLSLYASQPELHRNRPMYLQLHDRDAAAAAAAAAAYRNFQRVTCAH